ncbi:MAG TPA: hypothetical protein VGA53_01740 [Candidatus Paceibacterota bacterium]
MFQKIMHTFGLILLVELFLFYLLWLVHGFGGWGGPVARQMSDFEKIAMILELIGMFLAPFVIPLLVFRNGIIRKWKLK